MNRAGLITIIFIFLLIVLYSLHLPFFGDMIYHMRVACYIYDNNFTVILPCESFDNGNPTLYSLYLAILWKIFGKTLFISHLAIFPFVAGIIYQFNRLALNFLKPKYVSFAMILLLFEPTILTQVIMAGFDLIYVFLFITALRFIITFNRDNLCFVYIKQGETVIHKKQNKLFLNKLIYSLMLCLFPLLNLRGFSFVISLLLIQFFLIIGFRFQYSELKNKILSFIKHCILYLPSCMVFVGWLLYHYSERGWAIIHPAHVLYQSGTDIEQIIRNIFYVAWKISDFGRISIIVFLCSALIVFRKKIFKYLDNNNKVQSSVVSLLLIFTVVPVLTYVIMFVFSSYPVSHRHFMVIYPLLFVFAIYFFQFIKNRMVVFITYVIFILSLFFGHFILYPERFGNGWDASMKVFPYFKLHNQTINYFIEEKFHKEKTGTKYPLTYNVKFSKLTGDDFYFQDIDNETLDKFDYIVLSNISNLFTDEERAELEANWLLVKEFTKWPVYFRVYKKP